MSASRPFAFLLLLAVHLVAVKGDTVIIWSEEFDSPSGTQPDPAKWQYHIGDGAGHNLPGWGNSELEYYTSDAANAATDGNGNLVITARTDGASAYVCYYGACQYTSARLFSNCRFTHEYGRFEARLKTPAGNGLWPAFWMLGDNYDSLGWPNSGEIDIMELKGSNPTTVMGTIHGPGYSGAGGLTASYTLPGGQSFADDFHVFAIDWQPNQIQWSVDGNVFETRGPGDLNGNPWVFDHPFYILVDFAVGGQFDGNPTPDVIFPKQYYIDYIRVYDEGTSNITTPTTTTSGPKTTTTAGPQTTTTSSSGGNRNAYSNIEAESFDDQQGTSTESCSDSGGGSDVTQISNGDYLLFKDVDFGSQGATGIIVRYASGVTPGETGTISFHLDSLSNPYFSLLGIGYSNGWQSWLSEVGSVSPIPVDVHDVYVTFQSDYTDDFMNLNYFVFSQ